MKTNPNDKMAGKVALVKLTSEFEGAKLTTIEYHGRLSWIAREVGSAVGYEEGRRFADSITGEWSDELIEGTDWVRVVGDELAALKELSTESVESRAPSLILLFESGLHLACLKTRKPLGKKLRRFLADEVLPQLTRTGSYAPRKESPADREQRLMERERRLLATEERKMAELRQRKVEFERHALTALADKLEALGQASPENLAALHARAAEVATGQDLAVIKPLANGDWVTPTELAAKLGVSVQRVGRIITILELKGCDGQGLAGMSEPYHNTAAKTHRDVICYRYSPAAVALIRARLAAEATSTAEIVPLRPTDDVA